MARGPELSAPFARASALPDDGVVDWLSGLAIPQEGGLSLVGDADGSNLLGANDEPHMVLVRTVSQVEDFARLERCPKDARTSAPNFLADQLLLLTTPMNDTLGIFAEVDVDAVEAPQGTQNTERREERLTLSDS